MNLWHFQLYAFWQLHLTDCMEIKPDIRSRFIFSCHRFFPGIFLYCLYFFDCKCLSTPQGYNRIFREFRQVIKCCSIFLQIF